MVAVNKKNQIEPIKNIEKYGHRHIIKYEKFNKHHIEVSKWVMQLNEDIIKILSSMK